MLTPKTTDYGNKSWIILLAFVLQLKICIVKKSQFEEIFHEKFYECQRENNSMEKNAREEIAKILPFFLRKKKYEI
jgi:hypothetical protein